MRQLLSKSGKPYKRFGQRYPWREWFRRRHFVLRKGKDFGVAIHGMLQMIRDYGWKNGYHVRMKSTEQRIEVWTVLMKKENGKQ